MEPLKRIPITRMTDGVPAETEDVVAVEKRLRISVNGAPALNLYCSPVMIRELVVGVVHNEQLIAGEWCMERMSIVYGDEVLVDIPAAGSVAPGERTITSGCAGGISISRPISEGPLADPAVFAVATVSRVFHAFQLRSEAYKQTGGVHSAALTDGEDIIVFAEDIGRHNAVDKVIGYCLLEGISLAGTMMLASGRLSSEIASKCVRCGIPVLVSRAAPTSLAVEIAETANLTLVGFARGGRMNIYAGRERVIP